MNLGLNSAGWRTCVKSWCSNCFTLFQALHPNYQPHGMSWIFIPQFPLTEQTQSRCPWKPLSCSCYFRGCGLFARWPHPSVTFWLRPLPVALRLLEYIAFCSLSYYVPVLVTLGQVLLGVRCTQLQSLQPSASQGLWEIITYTDKRYQGCESNACKSWSILAARIWMPLLPMNVAPIQMTDCHLNLALTGFIYCMRFTLWFEERSIDFLTGFSVVFII